MKITKRHKKTIHLLLVIPFAVLLAGAGLTAQSSQDAAAGAPIDYLAHMRDLRLTDEQPAELCRRRANKNRPAVPLSEVRERLRQLGK